jgi:hypothetical protein
MDNLLSLVLEAHYPHKNHHRRYEVVVGRDLLNAWTVAICFGRTGRRGTEQRFASSLAGEMQAVIRDRLRRRMSAPRRIGCAYRLSALNTAPGFEAADWLPADLMTNFGQIG